MRIVGSLLAAAAITLAVSANGDEDSALIALAKEPKIAEALWRGSSAARVLLVRIPDDGSNRDGFAEYICSLIREHHTAKGVMVRIIEDQAWKARKEEIDIGAALCQND